MPAEISQKDQHITQSKSGMIEHLLPKMFAHQIEAVRKFIANGGRLRLLWETGTGKTYAYLACYFYACIVENRMLQGTIICPKVLIDGMWKPILKEFQLEDWLKVVNYEMVLYHPDLIKGCFLVIDEDHRVSNYKSKTAKVIKSYEYARYLIGGTGTAEPRGYTDHYMPLSIYFDLPKFSEWALKYGRYYPKLYKYLIHKNKKEQFLNDISYYCHSAKLAECTDMPEIIYKPIELTMTDEQKEYYRWLGLSQEERMLLTGGVRSMIRRKVCSDFWDRGEPEKIWDTKFNAVLELIEDIPERPLLVWGHFRKENIRLYEALKKKYDKVALWIGETHKDIEAWNRGDIEIAVCNPAAVGVGLNLQKCNTVIYSSVDWGIINYLQSVGRVKRIGQKNKIILHHLYYCDSIEIDIWKRLKKKEININEIMEFIRAETEM